MYNISPRDMNGHLLEAADILVWDEAPMRHQYLLEAELDRSLQDIVKNNTLLGGKYSFLLVISSKFFHSFAKDADLIMWMHA